MLRRDHVADDGGADPLRDHGIAAAAATISAVMPPHFDQFDSLATEPKLGVKCTAPAWTAAGAAARAIAAMPVIASKG